MALQSRFLIGLLIILAIAAAGFGFLLGFLGDRTNQASDAAGPSSASADREPIAAEQVRPEPPREQPGADEASKAALGEKADLDESAEAPEKQALPVQAPAMTREEYKRQKAGRGAGKALNEAFAEEAIDPGFTAEMQPKVASFLRRIYDDSRLRSVECRGNGCVIRFETSEADAVVGLMEQAEKDLGVSGGGALGGAPVKGRPGRYSFEALFLFDRG